MEIEKQKNTMQNLWSKLKFLFYAIAIIYLNYIFFNFITS